MHLNQLDATKEALRPFADRQAVTEYQAMKIHSALMELGAAEMSLLNTLES